MRKQHGFTLVELMVVLVVLAVVLGLATPALRDLVQRNRLVTQTNDLVADINLTRTTAISTGRTMTICPRDPNDPDDCGNNWNNGWLVFYDCDSDGAVDIGSNVCPNLEGENQIPEAIIKIREAPESDTSVTEIANAGFANSLRFESNGFLDNTGGTHVLRVCAEDVVEGRRISVGPGGRPTLTIWLSSEANSC